MKLVRSDGEVRDVGPVRFRLEAALRPIKLHGSFILEDVEARALVRELADAQRHIEGLTDIGCKVEQHLRTAWSGR